MLGQFNTTRKDYILEGFEYFLKGKDVVDPFCGKGDLLEWVQEAESCVGFDIDPDIEGVITTDSLLYPQDLKGKWVITNPPYLARNKNKDKSIYDKYGLDDLYKCAIQSILTCEGGILIVPVNFLSAETSQHIRERFFAKYDIVDCKVFEESVFEDTDYTVCAFTFQKDKPRPERYVNVRFMPMDKYYLFRMTPKFGWICGEEFHSFVSGPPAKGIGRYTLENSAGDQMMKVAVGDPKNVGEMLCTPEVKKSIMVLRAIDTGTQDGRIKLMDIREMGIDCLAGKNTSRNFAHIKMDNPPSIEQQVEIIKKFNEKIEWFRAQYNSIFLTAFRNSTKEYSRKRISFDVAYKLIERTAREANSGLKASAAELAGGSGAGTEDVS